MTRLTGNDAIGLMEAYNEVYNSSSDISDQEIMEDFGNWVYQLIDEGYDLSDYTWDDMLEEYVDMWQVCISEGIPSFGPIGKLLTGLRNRFSSKELESVRAILERGARQIPATPRIGNAPTRLRPSTNVTNVTPGRGPAPLSPSLQELLPRALVNATRNIRR